MSRDNNGIISRYVDTTSPLAWPTSRRTAYRTITNYGASTGNLDIFNTFRKWTSEGSNKCYTEINTALLNDNLTILQKHANYINDLRRAIKENLSWESVKLYRGLKLHSSTIQQISTGMVFLWPTFSSTSHRRSIAETFGDYLFEIQTSPNDNAYRADISNYSEYSEEEVIFYPYSGFRVKNIFKDARVIQLECMDTLQVESLHNSSNTPAPSGNYANASDPIPPKSAKVGYCGGNACTNCGKCCDWHRNGNGDWQKRGGATCTGYYLTGVCRGLYARRPGPPPRGGFHLEFRHDRDDRVCLCK